MNEFLAMSGYGEYVWPAFALGLGVLILNVVLARSALASAKREARRRVAMNQGKAS